MEIYSTNPQIQQMQNKAYFAIGLTLFFFVSYIFYQNAAFICLAVALGVRGYLYYEIKKQTQNKKILLNFAISLGIVLAGLVVMGIVYFVLDFFKISKETLSSISYVIMLIASLASLFYVYKMFLELKTMFDQKLFLYCFGTYALGSILLQFDSHLLIALGFLIFTGGAVIEFLSWKQIEKI